MSGTCTACAFLALSVTWRVAAHLFATGVSPTVTSAAREHLGRLLLGDVLLAPLGAGLRWLGEALALGCLAALGGIRLRTRALFALVAWSWAPAVPGRVVDLVVTWQDGPELTPELLPVLGRSASLAALLPARVWGDTAGALAEATTPFVIWSYLLLVGGLRRAERLPWRVALGSATAVRLGCWVLDAAARPEGAPVLLRALTAVG